MTVREGWVDADGVLQSVFGRGELASTGVGKIIDVPDDWPNAWVWNVESQQFDARPMTGEPPDLSDF